MTIPVVCVVLDGGPGTLNVSHQFSVSLRLCLSVPLSCLTVLCFSSQTIYNAMLNGTPCVILEGSGRIADVIAQVAGLPVSRVTIALIHQLMKKFFGQEYESFPDLKIIEWTKKVCDYTDDLNNFRPISKLPFLSLKQDKQSTVKIFHSETDCLLYLILWTITSCLIALIQL